MTDAESELLERAEAVFIEQIKPKAQLIDADPIALGAALGVLGENGLLSLKRPIEFGGPAIGERAFRHFQELSARYSGALSFLMTQHQSAVSMLAKSENQELRAALLPLTGETGAELIGIGISQLRRPGTPMVRAIPIEGGYVIDGEVPWITGFGFFHDFILGARLPDGRALFGMMPFSVNEEASPEERLERAGLDVYQTIVNESGDASIQFSPPMKLAAFQSANTVSARIENWFLSEKDVVFIKPQDWPVRNDMINIVLQGHFALGCAQAGIDCMRLGYERKPEPFILAAIETLGTELDECRKAAAEIPADLDSETTELKLDVRAWSIELAVKCAHAGVVVCGGAANSLDHPAQRVYREALVYSVSAQTTDIMRATLGRLAL